MRALTVGTILFSVALLVMVWAGVAAAQQTPAASKAVTSQTVADTVVRPDGPVPSALATFYKKHNRAYRRGFYGGWSPYYGGYYRPNSYYYRPYRSYGKSCYWSGNSYVCWYPNYNYRYW